MPLEHRKHCKRYNTPHDTHYLTFSCFKRRPFLSKDRSRQWLIDAIHRAHIKHDFPIWAWVIMPEHFHLLIHPRQSAYDISAILKSIKQPVTASAIKHIQAHAPEFLNQMNDRQPNGKSSHRFWQRGGGYDTNLWTPKHISEKIQYIHNNPVRRGLAAHPTNWQWSSAKDYERLRPIPLLPLDLTSRPW